MNNPHDPITAFGEIVRDLRAQTGLTQDELAKLSDEVAPYVAQLHPNEAPFSGLSRELVSGFEAPELKNRPRERSLTVLAHTFTEALRRVGRAADPDDIFIKLNNATKPVGTSDNIMVSKEALILDALLLTFPPDERRAKWEGIIAGVKKEREIRLEIQAAKRNARNAPHTED